MNNILLFVVWGLASFFGITPSISIGLSSSICKNKRHGIIHLKCSNGGITQLNFVVDKPELLESSNYFVRQELFNQVSKMGYEPINIEILVANKVKLYKEGKVFSLFKQDRLNLVY